MQWKCIMFMRSDLHVFIVYVDTCYPASTLYIASVHWQHNILSPDTDNRVFDNGKFVWEPMYVIFLEGSHFTKKNMFQNPFCIKWFRLDLQSIGSSPDLQRSLIRARQIHDPNWESGLGTSHWHPKLPGYSPSKK